MDRVHKRFTAEQVKVLLKGYCQGFLDRSAIEEILDIGRSRFFALPITTYNYSAIRDRLIKRGIRVSSPTIIARAKSLGCYQPRPRKKAHDREVVTAAIGASIHHRW